jgi:hypothetical protein
MVHVAAGAQCEVTVTCAPALGQGEVRFRLNGVELRRP